MRRISLLLSFFFIASGILLAKPVSPELAAKVAYHAFGKFNTQLSTLHLKEAPGGSQAFYYIFAPVDAAESGFIIIAGDDASIPVLGYSISDNYTASPSPSFQKWMEWYKQQIREIRDQNLEADSAINAQWEAYLNPIANEPIPSIQAVNPLMSTKWNQSPYYNAQCPYDNTYSQRTVSGCVATAMAQIMKFWDYPSKGIGSHSYSHSKYGTLSANFGGTTYNWASMPNTVNSSNTAVATLMYHCGVAVDMDYGVASQGGSGAYVITDRSPKTHCSEYAFRNYFDYDAGMEGVERANYTQTTWINKMKAELDAGRPILYAGFGQGGHCFVADGYNSSNYFHFNWGWGGLYDGYFSINSLNPGTGGAGAGAGTYNNGQQAIFNLKPKNGGGGNTTSLELYSNITITPSPVNYLQSFQVKVDIANNANSSITGDFAAAVFNANNEFVAFVDVINGGSIQAQSVATGTFTSNGMSELIPGTYYMGIYFRQGSNQYTAIDDGSYANFKQFSVVGDDGDMRLYAAVNINPNPVEQNKSLSVTFDVANYSNNNTFDGDISIDLHKSDGTWIRELAIKNNLSLPPQSHFTNGLTYTISSGLPEDPGDYKIQIWYLPNGGDWELLSSGAYSNPVPLTITAPGLQADTYENNNSQGTARTMSLSFSNDVAFLRTTGSNIHNGTDLDYYKLVLDAGYDYTITGRVHDAYSSSNGNTYTCDVTVAYLKEGTWSDYFDDIIGSAISMEDGGNIIFNISPFFTGQTGSYLLDLKITRTKRTNTLVSRPLKTPEISVYPVPAQKGQSISVVIEDDVQIDDFQVLSLDGKSIPVKWTQTASNQIQLHGDLSSGIYLIRVMHERGVSTTKLQIQ